MQRNFTIFMLAVAMAAICTNGDAATKVFGELLSINHQKGARGVSVEQRVSNDRPSFVVRVDVDHSNHVYKDQDLMSVNVVSEKSGYLYLFYVQADKSVVCLFPNKIQRNNYIRSRQGTTIPASTDDFQLRVGKPLGCETMISIVSLEPLSPSVFGVKSFADAHATSISADDLMKAVNVELKPKPSQWAEHRVSITTVASATARPQKRRIGLFVGISDYRDDRVNDLSVCDDDARRLADVMVDKGKLEAAIVLTDRDATKSRIRQAFEQLVAKSRPMDEIFIFWSGHGGRIADDNGDERDGDRLDEFLVPYDACNDTLTSLRESVILDDTFGRWIQELDGRKVVVILDACHSGGQATSVKSFDAASERFDFGISECARAKDIGQRDAVMLLSSHAEQISVERTDSTLSAMTYYLVERLESSERVTLKNAFVYLKPRVIQYVERNFPGVAQTPILVPADASDVYLRP